jgi:hypothetical protein
MKSGTIAMRRAHGLRWVSVLTLLMPAPKAKVTNHPGTLKEVVQMIDRGAKEKPE